MSKPINIQDQRFGRLVVKEYIGNKLWRCDCDCGSSHLATGSHLRHGDVSSCGCYLREWSKAKETTHGLTGSPEYCTWCNMRRRCYDPTNNSCDDYGERGITVCDRWLESFANFYADMGPRPAPGYTIERIENDKSYSPDNCKWATRQENVRNRRNTVVFEFRGQRKPLAEWADELVMPYCVLQSRLFNLGWTVEEAFTTPPRPRRKPG